MRIATPQVVSVARDTLADLRALLVPPGDDAYIVTLAGTITSDKNAGSHAADSGSLLLVYTSGKPGSELCVRTLRKGARGWYAAHMTTHRVPSAPLDPAINIRRCAALHVASDMTILWDRVLDFERLNHMVLMGWTAEDVESLIERRPTPTQMAEIRARFDGAREQVQELGNELIADIAREIMGGG